MSVLRPQRLLPSETQVRPAAPLSVPTWLATRVRDIDLGGPCIGRGAFGKVFAGRCVTSGQPVAVKRQSVPAHHHVEFADAIAIGGGAPPKLHWGLGVVLG